MVAWDTAHRLPLLRSAARGPPAAGDMARLSPLQRHLVNDHVTVTVSPAARASSRGRAARSLIRTGDMGWFDTD